MDAKTKDKREQIRSVTSRDWLKQASVSMAKLDQVKTKVYNLGIADPKQLKATSDNLLARQTGPSSEPPLSSLLQQRHVWGSNSSIPDLLKQQTEKKKLTRPWSAQNSSVQMKVVLKKPRPHSAVDSTSKPPRHTSGKKAKKTSIAVKGAHYEAAERPPGGISSSHTVSGWAAPPGGIYSEHAIQMVTQEQDIIDYNDRETFALVDMPPPQPPRGSPDFTHILETNGNGHRINSAVGELVDGLLEDTRRPSPREPIRLTLPSAQQEEEDEKDVSSDGEQFTDVIDNIDNWLEEKKKYNKEQLDIDKILNGFDNRIELGSISSKLLRTDVGDSVEGLCSDLESSGSETETVKTEETNTTLGKKKKGVRVTFDEEKNKTRTITPRGEDYETVVPVVTVDREPTKPANDAVQKTSHATPDLRSVNGRIGFVHKPRISSKRIERKPKSHNNNTPTDKSQVSPGRAPASKCSVPFSTISVSYLEDEDYLNETRTVSARRRKTGQREIDTLISQLSDSDSEPDEESRPESRTKAVSKSLNRNYYHGSLNGYKPKVLTRKTLELGDGSVIERKSVFVLNSHRPVNNKPYVVPMENRPKTVPTDDRNKSSAKKSYSPRKDDHSVSAIVEPTKQLSLEDKTTPRQTKYEDYEKAKSDHSPKISTERKVEVKLKKEVTFASTPEVGSHDCKCVTPTSASSSIRRPPSSPYKPPYRKPSSAKKQEDERVKFPKPLSLVKKRIEEERRKLVMDRTPQIITKHREYEVEDSEGVKECRDMQDYLIDAGVPVTLETLYRALLPPTQYPVPRVSLVTNTSKPFPRHTVGLVSKPSFWLPEEHKRLREANKLVRQANLSLRYQELEEEREALREAGITPMRKKKKRRIPKKQKSIAGYHPTPARTQSAPSGEQTKIANKRHRSAPPGGRRKQAEVRENGDKISPQDLM